MRRDVIAVIEAGAAVVIAKTITGTDLANAVCRVAGDAVFNPRLAGFVLDAFSRRSPRWTNSTGSRNGAR